MREQEEQEERKEKREKEEERRLDMSKEAQWYP